MMEANGGSAPPPPPPAMHVAMFPFFAFGHISPFIQFSNKLLADPTIKISFLSPPSAIPRISSSLSSSAHIVPLKIPSIQGLPPGLDTTADMTPPQTELLKKAVDEMKPDIEALLRRLRPHVIFHDFTHQWLASIASPLNIKTFMFSVFSAISGAYVMVPARLQSPHISPTLVDLKNPPPDFPPNTAARLKSYEAKELLYAFTEFGGPSVYNRVVACNNSSSAIVLKTCMEMEAPYIEFIQAQYGKPVLLAGPVVPGSPVGPLDERWASWLGRFPKRSVVVSSFGSETRLRDDQMRELLLGLEMLGSPFLVVLNFPDEDDPAACLRAALPEGFEERVKDRGVVHTGWVQQPHILAHDSVGCFVCHAGFSSVAEGLVSDCQLVMLPCRGDQFLNARLVSGDLKAGVEVKRDEESGSFAREDVCAAVKAVMEGGEKEPGKTVRENHAKWRDFLVGVREQDQVFKGFVEKMKEMVLN
ncbi:hypothetical protein ACLOJK_039490 [Asimina triloba]